MTKCRHINRKRQVWTKGDERLLRRLYPNVLTEDIAARLGRPVANVYGRAHRMGLRKSKAFLASAAACRWNGNHPNSVRCRFKPGQVPPNKGLRRPGYAPGRMATTMFKKGQMPQTWVPIGTEVVDRDGYRKVKVSDNRKLASRFNWRFVHRLVCGSRC